MQRGSYILLLLSTLSSRDNQRPQSWIQMPCACQSIALAVGWDYKAKIRTFLGEP